MVFSALKKPSFPGDFVGNHVSFLKTSLFSEVTLKVLEKRPCNKHRTFLGKDDVGLRLLCPCIALNKPLKMLRFGGTILSRITKSLIN